LLNILKKYFFVENGGQLNSQEENEKKFKFSQKISSIVNSCIGFWTLSPNLWFHICNVRFLQHNQVKIFPENLSQNKAEDEKEKKPRICKKIIPAL
jgi:hypothetical protein